jgi:hypothetical protein
VTPLSAIADLAHYAWPDPDDERICAQIYRMAKAYLGGGTLLDGRYRSNGD